MSFVSKVVKQNFMVVVTISLILGGVVGFVFSEKKVNTSCVLAMEDNSKEKEIKKIVVDLSGAVENPGIYELDEGSRVGDLISLGGSILKESSALWISKNLNLSKKLEDSSKVYIPFEWEIYSYEESEILSMVKPEDGKDTSNESSSNNLNSPEESSETLESGGDNSTESSKINVNTATSSDLDTLPGIGPAFAEKIIDNRPYSNFSEFESKSGLWKSVSASIKDLILF